MALVQQQAPTLFLSFEATQTLRDCHRVAPKDNGTLLRDAVAAARSYALWDYAGLATRDRKALEARLEELQRCDPSAKVSEDAFVAAVIHGARVGVPPRPRPKRLVDADASWEAYRARLEKLSHGEKPDPSTYQDGTGRTRYWTKEEMEGTDRSWHIAYPRTWWYGGYKGSNYVPTPNADLDLSGAQTSI